MFSAGQSKNKRSRTWSKHGVTWMKRRRRKVLSVIKLSPVFITATREMCPAVLAGDQMACGSSAKTSKRGVSLSSFLRTRCSMLPCALCCVTWKKERKGVYDFSLDVLKLYYFHFLCYLMWFWGSLDAPRRLIFKQRVLILTKTAVKPT